MLGVDLNAIQNNQPNKIVMKANPSNRWKNDILPVVESHDFGLLNVYDAGPSFRQDDHQCDFCGTHLRYTAEIAAEDDPDIEYKVGLDCLEHAMGTSWSHMQDVERKIKDLKEEAKKQRRKEAFAEEYEEMIDWLERRLEISEDGFLRNMYEVLTTGESEFTQNMEEAVKKNIRNTDLDELRERQKWVDDWLSRIDDLIEIIVETDDLEWDERKEKYVGRSSGYGFVKSVRDQLERKSYISDNQMEALNDIYSEYQEKQSENEETEEEEDENIPAVPF